MNSFHEVTSAAAGLNRLAAGQPNAADKFNASRAGLITALGLYLSLVLIIIVLQAAIRHAVPYGEIGLGLVANILPTLGLAAVSAATVRLLQLEVSAYALLVPAIYALSLILVLSLAISLILPTLSPIALGAMGYLLFRVARGIGRMNAGIALSFAALNLMVLVAMPIGLYMLFSPLLAV